MTLSGYFALNSVFAPVCLAPDSATFENNCVKTYKNRQILSAAQIFDMDSNFWQYKVYADIRVGSAEKMCQRTVGLRVNARLEHLFLDFENNYAKLNTNRPIL